MRKLISVLLLGLGLTAGPASATVISTVGDADCFGLGGSCADGDLWRDGLGGSFFSDYRDASDLATAPHTDYWDSPGNPSWTHSYSLGGAAALSASFDLLIAGFADIGSVTLYADAMVLAVFDFSGQFQTVHELSASVPLSAIDGSTTFSLDGPGSDGYIIDHSVLTIRTDTGSSVPEPTTMAILGLGLAGLGWSRRRASA